MKGKLMETNPVYVMAASPTIQNELVEWLRVQHMENQPL